MHARTITRRRSIALLTIALMAGTATHALAQVVPAPYVEPGKPGDPASWAGTTEFKNQWGLGVINAQYAYALGYTGKGVGLGVFDTGTSNFLHEFDGRFVAVESKGTLNVAMDAAGVPWNIPNPPIHAGDAYDLMGDRTIVGDQHGTEVGGVIAAARNGVDSNAHGMQGVAFGATLVAANGLYVGPNNGSIEAIDAGLFGAALDGFVANNVRVMNNSWEILPNAWVNDSSGKVKTSATGPLTDVIDQYNTDTSKKVFDVMHSAAHDHQMLFVAAAGNGGSVLVPTAFASLPYFQPDMAGYMIAVVNVGSAKLNNGTKFPGNPDYVFALSSTPCAQTRQWCVAAPGSSIVSTGFDIGDYNSASARTIEQALAVTDPATLTTNQKNLLSIYPGSVFDDVNKTWFYPSYKTTNGTSVAAPFVTGEAGIAIQRFPWMTTPQITEAVLTTSRYLPDGTAGADVINRLNGAALSMTQIPNFQTGWGLIDLKSLMNGPAQLLASETYTLPTGSADVFSNSITDAWLRYEQKTQDPADETAWQAEIVARGWQNGLPANANATDSSEYKFQLARAADRAARAADPGNFIKAGPGTLTLSGNNTYSGATEVQAGLLNIDGINTNSRAVVDDGGTLGGSGTSHGLWVKSGGVVAPGHSIGTLYFDDVITLDLGSTYHAELGANGMSDLLSTTGAASIGGAKLLLSKEGGQTELTSAELDLILNGATSQRFTLLNAAKGITGAFDTSLLKASDAVQRLTLIYNTTSAALQAAPAPYVEPGKLGDPNSWVTAEFNSDWALGAINAQYAYALGITGAGVKLGNLDAGLLGTSNEFSGPGKYVSVHSTGVLEYPMPSASSVLTGKPPVKAGDAFDLNGDFPIVGSSHGTRTSGDIAANRDGQGVHGVAFDATLVVANSLYAGPHNGSIEEFDPGIFKAGIDGIVAAGARVVNNSWNIVPVGWAGSSAAVGKFADVVNQYNSDTTKKIFTATANAAKNSDMLFVFSAGNDGPKALPDALNFLPYFQPDTAGHMLLAVNISQTAGTAFPGVTNYFMSTSSTPCGDARGWCVAAPGTKINAPDFKKPTSATDFLPIYAAASGTSESAPMVTGVAGLAIQRFPWMTTPQIMEAITTTSRYLPDPQNALANDLNGDALTMTQVPNSQTGWGLIDIKNLMNGPAQLLSSETYTLPANASAVFSNTITDAWFRYEQKNVDSYDEFTWQQEITKNGWKNGLPASATAADQSEYTYQMARAAARVARAADPGDFIKAGPGTLTLTGNNTYSGATRVQSGLLNIDGINKNSRAIVDDGGTLGGSGSSHGLWVKPGGVVAPGHSIGSLYFDDAGIQLDAGSIYRAELGQKGASDQLITTGTASIDRAKLLLTREGGLTALTSSELDTILNGGVSQRYTLLTAAKGVTGAFDTSQMQASDAFQRLQLIYSTSSVALRASPAAYVDPGKLGDPNSWKTAEFNSDWALGAINAQYAYALGITGAGVKLGDLDDGTLGISNEFAGDGKFISVHSVGVLEYPMPDQPTWAIPNPPVKVGDKFDIEGGFSIVFDPHGTHTAGIIAANRDGQGVHGVSFGATLVAANALYAGPYNGIIETFDPNVFKTGIDGIIAAGARVANNSWGISPDGWTDSNSGGAVGTLADVANQYNIDTTKEIFNTAADAAHKSQMLFVFAAGNGGPNAPPDALTSMPYFRPDMMGYLFSVVNLARPTDGDDVGAKFTGVTDYVMSWSSTPCDQTRGWCVAAPGTNINSTYFIDRTGSLASYQAAVAKPASQRSASEAATVAKYAADAQYIDTVHKVWYVPSYHLDTGTSMAAPMVTGTAGLAIQRFPWMTTPQIAEAIMTTSRYLPDAKDAALNALNGAAMSLTQIPNFQTGWGMIDIKNLMNGPAQLMWTETFTLPASTSIVFSNSITDAWLRYEQKTQDPADEAAWQEEIASKGWKDGLPATATAVDQSEYTYQTARAADRAARANDHGDLIKSGGGALTLTGTNTYSGATEIREGLLNLDGVNTNSRTIVDAGGTLGGGGTGHGLWARAGGIVAPGHSIGALHFDDAGIQLDAGSIYHAELGQNGAADLLATTGAASIDAAKLLATTEGSSSALTYAELNQLLNGHESQSFLLLTADKGVSGAFDTSLMQASDAFQHLQLNYSTTSVSLLAFQNSGAIAQDGIWPRSAGQITQDEIWPRKVGAITNDPTTWIDTTPAAAVTEPPTPTAEPESATPPADNAVVPDVAAPVVEPSSPSKPAIVDVVIERGARYTLGTGDGGLPEPLITSGKGQIGGSHLSLPAKMIKTLTRLAPNKGMFQAYEILTAQQGLEGTFDANDLPKFAFFNLSLTYSENTVTLDVLHRDIGFADIAATPNQAAVAAGADRLKPDNIIHDAILYVPTVQEARLDYQYMTGELHGDVAGEVLDDSRIMRDAVLERMAKRVPDTSAFWLKTIGSFGSTASDHNAVKVNRQTDGLMAGADLVLGDSWIVGAAANYEATPLRTAGMGIASITSYHLAGYGGGDLLGLSLHLGGAYGHYNAKTTRVVGVADLAGIEQARYGANQSQAFGEIGLPLVFDDTAIEPFAGIAYTDAGMEGFAETGGPASLTARDQSLDRTQSTLGARLSVTYRDNETVFTPNLELAWAHAFSGIRPGMAMAFVDGPAGNEFTVAGTSADRDAAVIRIGLDAAVGDGFSVGAGYEGQIGPHAQDHGVRLDIRVNY